MFPLVCILLIFSLVALYSLRKRAIFLEEKVLANEKERETMYRFLDRLGTNITMGADTTATMDLIVDFAQEATKADAACIFVRDRGTTTLRARVVRGLFPPLQRSGGTSKIFAKRKYVADIVKKVTFEIGEGFVGRVAERGEPMLVTDVHEDPELRELEETGVEVRDLIAVPLVIRGENLGVLIMVNKKEGVFDEIDKSLVLAFADQAAVTLDMVRLYKVMAEQHRLEHELELARNFQFLLLPREKPDLEKVDMADFYRPAKEVGGDYFDYIPIDDKHLGIVVGDVSGKGVPGALVMASVRATLRAEARITRSPKEVLQKVNDRAVSDTKDSVFITMTYGILNTETGIFRFCRAGHEPVICCNATRGDLRTYTPDGMALGLIEGEMFGITEEKEIDLSAEEMIVLYTDGVVEAMNDEQQEYGETRFHNRLMEFSNQSPELVVQNVMEDIEKFTRGLPQHDDITLMVLCWRKRETVKDVENPAATASTA